MCFFNNQKLAELRNENDLLKIKYAAAEDARMEAEEELAKLKIVNPKEEELNNKYPKSDVLYTIHETDGVYEVDVRTFINSWDFTLPSISGINDECALNCLKWVIDNIKYTDDKKAYGFEEYWAHPYQTLKRKVGDCEDGAILLYSIMLKANIPYWKIRISAGDVWVPDSAKGLNTTADIEDIRKWFSQKAIDYGTILKVLPQELKKENIKEHQQSFEKAIEIGMKEQDEKCEHFVDVLGKSLQIAPNVVKSVEKEIETNLESITKTKIDLITIQRIYKYYALLVIQDITGKKEILDNLKKDKPLGTKGSSGHAYVTYYCEEANKWVALDWCYYPNKLAIADRLDYKEDKLYGGIWFSFNQKFSYALSGTKITWPTEKHS